MQSAALGVARRLGFDVTHSFANGVHHRVPFEDYLAIDAVNNSALSDMDRSPAHCYALHIDPNRPQQASTAAMTAGSLLHCLVLEPDLIEQRYVVKPEEVDYRSKDGRAWRDAQTRTIVGADDMQRARLQREAIMSNDELRSMLHEADTEITVVWTDKATGLTCKARPDAARTIGRACRVIDIKTTTDITPRSIQRAIATFGYHRQRAHYCAGLRAVGHPVGDFVFGFVSSTYPYLAVPYVLDEETAQQGEDEVAELMERYAYCKAAGKWPVCGSGVQSIGLPAYEKRTSEVEIDYV